MTNSAKSEEHRRRPTLWMVCGATFLIALGAWLAFRSYILSCESELAALADPQIEALPPMIWAHRGGRSKKAAPNSPAAMRAANRAGYVGVEMDVWARDEGLIVAHYRDQPGEQLAKVIAAVGPEQFVWLDFKALSGDIARKSAPLLAKALPENKRTQIFIESASLEALDHLRRAVPGVRAIYTPPFWRRIRFSPGYALALRDIKRHHISVVGWPARDLDDETAQALRGIGLFTFTINKPADMERLKRLGVDVILTDRIREPRPKR